MAVVRDPVSATFSGVLGSMASIETTAGTGAFRAGVQGFIPRPRLNSHYGLGRIEAFFPRAYVGGHLGSRARYFSSIELNFERVPVPGVTTQSGTPAVGATGIVSFARIDFDLSPSNTLTLEGLFLPATSSYLRPEPAAAAGIGARRLRARSLRRRRRSHGAQPARPADAARRRDEPRDDDHAGRRRRRRAAARTAGSRTGSPASTRRARAPRRRSPGIGPGSPREVFTRSRSPPTSSSAGCRACSTTSRSGSRTTSAA